MAHSGMGLLVLCFVRRGCDAVRPPGRRPARVYDACRPGGGRVSVQPRYSQDGSHLLGNWSARITTRLVHLVRRQLPNGTPDRLHVRPGIDRRRRAAKTGRGKSRGDVLKARRPDGRTALVVGLLLLAVGPSGRPAVGQVSVRFALGARYATALVKDSIVVPIHLRPSIAPTLQLTVRDELRGPWTVDGILD